MRRATWAGSSSGGVIGAAAALLLAPKTGRETREILAERGSEVARARAGARQRGAGPRRRVARQEPRAVRGADAAADDAPSRPARTPCARRSARDDRRRVAEVELPDPDELEERRDKTFSRRVALTTAVYAVVLAIASLGGNNAMKEMLLAQQESSEPVGVLPGQGHPRAPVPRQKLVARGAARRALDA